MSAIFGILRLDGDSASVRELERMGNALAHRGPDGRAHIVAGPVGFGHCLMRVNQEDRFEAQPLYDRATDTTLVADVRLDNREELSAAFGLDAADLREMPDSALVMRAYKEWGEDCAAHLLGDFAFAIWDGRAKKLLLGRDHMGQRYVHYHHGKSFFAFATELKALWALPGVPRQLCETEIGKYLLLDPRRSDGATFFEDICGVPSGTTVAIDLNGARSIRRYWEPRPGSEHANRDEAYYIETYRRIFAEAVECRIRRLIAPPALCLSAGYDSAAIAGLCGPILTARGRQLITVSSVMPEDYRGPLPCARRWVELCRRDMHHLDVRYFVRHGETLFTNVEKTCLVADGVPRVEQYVIDGLFREAARAGARLIMDGLGGDQTLNQRGGGALTHFLRTGQFRRFMSEFGPHLRLSGHSLWQTLRRDLVGPFLPRWLGRAARAARRGFAPLWSSAPIAPGFASASIKTGVINESEILGRYWFDSDPRARTLQVLRNWMASSGRNDANAAAAHWLDITRPLMDKRAVEFGLAIPEDLYVKNGRSRYLACRALADIYPREFQTRLRNQDSLGPDNAGMLKDSQARLKVELARLSANARLRNYLDFDKLQKMLGPSVAAPRPGPANGLALRALRTAQYIDWLEGKNM
jgi:asparagine synthase (glutamine-hydrolysing)